MRTGPRAHAISAAAACVAALGVVLLAQQPAPISLFTAEQAAAAFAEIGFPLDRVRALQVAGSAKRRLGHRLLGPALL